VILAVEVILRVIIKGIRVQTGVELD